MDYSQQKFLLIVTFFISFLLTLSVDGITPNATDIWAFVPGVALFWWIFFSILKILFKEKIDSNEFWKKILVVVSVFVGFMVDLSFNKGMEIGIIPFITYFIIYSIIGSVIFFPLYWFFNFIIKTKNHKHEGGKVKNKSKKK